MTQLITTTEALQEFCDTLSEQPFITLDTEFLREKTYYPKLCLIQLGGKEQAAAIDPLIEDIDLAPLFSLLRNENIIKVLHAARQDIEIFYQLMGETPKNLFDTQIAAQILGLGDNIGYEALIRKKLDRQIDKGQRYTDWAQRPLTEKQLHYAIGDVTHLYEVYQVLMQELNETGRASWLEPEMQTLSDPALYEIHPEDAWKRIRLRANSAEQLGRLKQLAAWREATAQSNDTPRNRIVRDEVLVEIATNLPKSEATMRKIRSFPQHLKSQWRDELWKLCAALPELPQSEWPELVKNRRPSAKAEGRLEMLRLLMKQVTREHQVSAGFLCNRETLEELASGEQDDSHPLLTGWRYEVFGKAALELLQGKQAAILDPQTGDIRFKAIG